MNFFKKLFLVCSLIGIAGCAFGVNDEEITKIKAAAPEKASVESAKPRKVLVFSLCQGFRHSSVPYCSKAMEILGQKTGAYTSDDTTDKNAFTAENLKQYDAIILNNTTKLTFDEPQRKALMDFVKGGKGIVGIHGATDNFYEWPEAAEMMGGTFDGHPWNAGGTWAVKIEDTKNPVAAAFQGKDFKIKDEIYRTKQINLRQNARVIVGLDLSDEKTASARGIRKEDVDIPISWIRDFGKGRVFYCSFGHNHHIFWNTMILKHYLDGIQFAIGDLKADATPLAFDEEPGGYTSMINDIKTFKRGESRKDLIKIEDAIFNASGDQLRDIEAAMIKFLANERAATLASKQFVCEKLGLIGTEKSVDVLSKMLLNEDTSDMARYGLEDIKADAADAALVKAMDKAKGDIKIGIITSVAARRIDQAAKPLADLITSSDDKLAKAAISALGLIANEDAADALLSSMANVKSSHRLLAEDALIMCADSFAAEGKTKEAYALYKKVNKFASTDAVTAASMTGMFKTADQNAADILADAIQSKNDYIKAQAISLISEIDNEDGFKKAVKGISKLDTFYQVQILNEAGQVEFPAALEFVKSYIDSEDSQIRIAAINSLGRIGTDKEIKSLVEIAASSSASAEKSAARESLYILKGSNTDRLIIDMIEESKNLKIAAELVIAAGRRKIADSVDVLAKMSSSSDTALSREAFKALSMVAGKDDFGKLVQLLVNLKSGSARSYAENAALSVMLSEKANPAPIISAIKVEKKPENIASLMFLLGKTDDAKSLKILRDGLSNSDEMVKAAAIRALSDRPEGTVAKDLMEVSVNSGNKIHKVLAFRGFVAAIPKESGRSVDENMELFKKAMQMASGSQEKKQVLSSLSQLPNAKTLAMAASYLDDEELKSEAVSATVAIAGITAGGDQVLKEQTKTALQKVLEVSKNESIERQANRILGRL